jgi:hypothetical protein
MRLGVVKSILLERQHRRLTVACTGGIAPVVLTFGTAKEVLEKYDELVAIEENEKNVEPS